MMGLTLHQWVLLSIAASPCLAAIYNDPWQLTKTSYDYIVIGSGAAGSVVAARLSEDSYINVLLVEAGISDAGILASQVPLLAPSLTPGTPYDWNYTTVPQTGYNNRVIPYSRGKMLGGSTSVNFMVYSRGAAADFDRYASLTGDSGWNWNNMQQYAFKNEDLVPPADGHNTSGQYIPSLHSTSGALSVSLPGYPTPLDSRVIQTTQQLSSQFPFNPDMIGGNVLGIGWTFASIGNGTRSSASTAYLTPARPNLDIVLNAQATKLLKTGWYMGSPSFHGVTIQKKIGAIPRTLTARYEIIVSAGSFGTPSLLQLSGIGDTTTLRGVGISPIVANPSVGVNMSDHALVPVVFSVNETNTFETVFGQDFTSNMAQWQANKTGPLAGGVCNHFGWFRLPQDSPILQSTPDPATGPNGSHYELIFSDGWVVPGVPPPTTGNFMSVTANLISPTSRGSIKITSSNAFSAPTINPNWVTTAFDIATLIQAVRSAQAFVAAPAWQDYVVGPYGGINASSTDQEIETYIRNNAATVFHATGTASMSPRGASWGVVDPDLKVKGVEGLRIVDGSVIPMIPNAHTQGPVYLFAERGAALIRATRLAGGWSSTISSSV